MAGSILRFVELEVGVVPQHGEDLQSFTADIGDCDCFLYSGPILPESAIAILDQAEVFKHCRRLMLVLATQGGDADAAYRIASRFKVMYQDDFLLVVNGFCKSAGTLVAMAASRILMSDRAELGPLDIQLFQPDEFIQRSSGLAVSQAVEFVCSKAFSTWEDCFLRIRASSGGNITTQTAAEIATQLTVGLFSPIMARIDPLRAGEHQRWVNVAQDYGVRLGGNPSTVKRLIEAYPSHSSVIDRSEAERLLTNVLPLCGIWERIIGEVGARLQERLDLPADPTKHEVDPGLLCHIIIKAEDASHEDHGDCEVSDDDSVAEHPRPGPQTGRAGDNRVRAEPAGGARRSPVA